MHMHMHMHMCTRTHAPASYTPTRLTLLAQADLTYPNPNPNPNPNPDQADLLASNRLHGGFRIARTVRGKDQPGRMTTATDRPTLHPETSHPGMKPEGLEAIMQNLQVGMATSNSTPNPNPNTNPNPGP